MISFIFSVVDAIAFLKAFSTKNEFIVPTKDEFEEWFVKRRQVISVRLTS